MIKVKIEEKFYDYSQALRARNTTNRVIVHHAAAQDIGADEIHDYHKRSGMGGIAYHFYVRSDGTVERGRTEGMVGAHTAGHNTDSIGLCFEGNFEKHEMPEAQRQSGRALMAYIFGHYGRLEVQRHSDVNATACPGKYFPFEEVIDVITQTEFNEMADTWLRDLGNRTPSEWSEEARQWAEGEGLVQGDEQGNMQYKRPLTREEYVVLQYRQNEKKGG